MSPNADPQHRPNTNNHKPKGPHNHNLDSASGTPIGWPLCLQTHGLRRTSCLSCGSGYKKKLPRVKEQSCKRHRCSTVCRNTAKFRTRNRALYPTSQPPLMQCHAMPDWQVESCTYAQQKDSIGLNLGSRPWSSDISVPKQVKPTA